MAETKKLFHLLRRTFADSVNPFFSWEVDLELLVIEPVKKIAAT